KVDDGVQKKKIPLLIGMDTNAHSTLWGSDTTNKRGEQIEEMCASHQMNVCNEGKRFTFVGGVGSSVIDVTFANDLMLPYVTLWRVSQKPTMSDHKYIMFRIDLHMQPTLLRNLRRVKWSEFRYVLRPLSNTTLKGNESEVYLSEIERLAYDLTQCIKDALDVVAPLREKKHRRVVPWWTKELSGLRKMVKRAERRLKKTQSVADKETYYFNKREYRRVIELERRQHWRKRCTELDSQQAVIAAIQRQKEKKKSGLGLFPNNTGNFSISDNLTRMILTHFNNATIYGSGEDVLHEECKKKESGNLP
ncbi:Uncharacterized protein FKW44_021054, partial [Caligus rogercresseyi]